VVDYKGFEGEFLTMIVVANKTDVASLDLRPRKHPVRDKANSDRLDLPS
jgi:hypothetical protein